MPAIHCGVPNWLNTATLPVNDPDQDQRGSAGPHADGEEAERAGALDERAGPDVIERHAQHGAGHDQFAAPGAWRRCRKPDASAATTPSTAMQTPIDFRFVSGSMPSKAPTTMVCSGSVASARLARAAVVKDIAML